MATIRYLVNKVEEAVNFYTDLLGFEVEERWGPAFVIVTKDGIKLWLSGPETSAAKPMPDGRKPVAGGWNRFVLEFDNLEAVVAKLKEANATFRNEILSGTGGKQVLVEDPSGNPIELFQAR